MLLSKLLVSALAVGAAAVPRPGVPAMNSVRVRGRSYVSVPVMLRRRRLRLAVNERAGIYTLHDGGYRVVIVPGFNTAEVDGRVVDLPYPPVFHRDELLVPSQLFLCTRKSPSAGHEERIPLGTVVLDPGHGGRDSGALGPGGLKEKDVALSVALRLKRLLERRGVKVRMTRSADRFVSLLQRSRIANSSGADLFVSIHCNAARNLSARGIESFALSPGISDAYRARQAAARHRPSDLVRGAADLVSTCTEKTIMRAHMSGQRRRSLLLARCLQSEMVRALGGRNRGVKLRNFSVLRETYLPAVLAEVGFVSHPATEARMRTSEYLQRMAGALASGLARYARRERLRLDRIAGRAAPAGSGARLAVRRRPAGRKRQAPAPGRHPAPQRRAARPARRARRGGYWALAQDGRRFAYGSGREDH
jgi:N-acetylmuramoyl-L-alanine amidase